MKGDAARQVGADAESAFPTVQAFESGTLNPEAFDHAAHVYIAWKLLGEDAPVGATARFLGALRRLTVSLGIESRYHETISCFYMTLIAERRAEHPGLAWQGGSFCYPTAIYRR
jgi:hypothetical protein